jgi:hypothetical protein
MHSSREGFSKRADLFSWAALFAFLITDWDGAKRADSTVVKQFQTGIEELSRQVPNTLRAMSPRPDRRPISHVTEGWANAVRRALADDLQKRPNSVDAVWRTVMPRNPLARLVRLWRKS